VHVHNTQHGTAHTPADPRTPDRTYPRRGNVAYYAHVQAPTPVERKMSTGTGGVALSSQVVSQHTTHKQTRSLSKGGSKSGCVWLLCCARGVASAIMSLGERDLSCELC